MRYLALASDYDGTLAADGRVDEATLQAIDRLRASGRKFILVSGRRLEELLHVFPHVNRCDRLVLENGALLYRPDSREEKVLAERPPEIFIKKLQERGVDNLAVGRAIAATWHPHETTVMEVIRELGLELQVILNKGAVMVLPSGVDKASGLIAALENLGLSPQNTVAVGDAENDGAFMNICSVAVAVANALPALKEGADWVTNNKRGAGVVELIDKIIASDLSDIQSQRKSRPVN